ncbi:ribonuclease P protein subunit rpr2 isoform X1 [Odontomachus brunneus]|uniref:ribonuclease P protein subunit rpr2 isoform X1 n=2 Tax=Odontomachus brunneus TaxID=486640 RepID=UPI0013F1F39C|nr:ribonuclease P protein subunit rpr2 isoform X1 [Odontomachus brunneus]
MMKTGTKFCQSKDILERMNYLYQASHLMALKNKVISSYYGNMIVGCARKAVLRMEPDLKRILCKCCQTPLIPGETARVRLTSKPVKGIKWTCLTCMNIKRFPTKKGHKLWLDDPQAIIEILDYTPRLKKEDVQQTDPQKILTDLKDKESK